MNQTYEDLEDEVSQTYFLRNQLDTGKITMEEYLKLIKPKPMDELTYGQKAVGVSFNPSSDVEINKIKEEFASIIDHMNDLRNNTANTEVKRLASVAITEAQTAQMWAVKAITYKD